MRETRPKFAQAPDRRGAKRYPVSLRMEISREEQGRGPSPALVFTRDVSMRGVYFFSETEQQVDSRFNFVVIFVRQISGKEGELMKGVARTVRCERLDGLGRGQFGIAASIEKTTHLVGE